MKDVNVKNQVHLHLTFDVNFFQCTPFPRERQVSYILCFMPSGNYDEGFGREQRKADWVKKDASGSVPSAVSDEANHTGDELALNGHEEEE